MRAYTKYYLSSLTAFETPQASTVPPTQLEMISLYRHIFVGRKGHYCFNISMTISRHLSQGWLGHSGSTRKINDCKLWELEPQWQPILINLFIEKHFCSLFTSLHLFQEKVVFHTPFHLDIILLWNSHLSITSFRAEWRIPTSYLKPMCITRVWN